MQGGPKVSAWPEYGWPWDVMQKDILLSEHAAWGERFLPVPFGKWDL